jgi:signal recognition particle subunit SRP54
VVDAMTGQDAVNQRQGVPRALEVDGVILTKFDSDTRGGAALSVKRSPASPSSSSASARSWTRWRSSTPTRIAGRILGMGDVVSLVEKAQEEVSEEEAEALRRRWPRAR